jgi:hypothetical protein
MAAGDGWRRRLACFSLAESFAEQRLSTWHWASSPAAGDAVGQRLGPATDPRCPAGSALGDGRMCTGSRRPASLSRREDYPTFGVRLVPKSAAICDARWAEFPADLRPAVACGLRSWGDALLCPRLSSSGPLGRQTFGLHWVIGEPNASGCWGRRFALPLAEFLWPVGPTGLWPALGDIEGYFPNSGRRCLVSSSLMIW